MLTAQTIGLGQDASDYEGCDVPQTFIDRYLYLELASDEIWEAFTRLTAIMSMTGGATVELLQQYDDLRSYVVPPIELAIDERNSIAGVVPQLPKLPPRSTTLSTIGLGFVPISTLMQELPDISEGFIPASRIRFEYGSATGGLGDALGWIQDYYADRQYLRQQQQLGFPWGLVIVAVVAGIALVGWEISRVRVERYTSLADQAASRADGKRAEEKARTARVVMRAYEAALAKCAATAKSTKEMAACMKAAGESAANVAKAVPDMPKPTRSGKYQRQPGRSFTEWVGILAIGAAVAGIGIFAYKRRDRIKQMLSRGRKAKKEKPEPGLHPEVQSAGVGYARSRYYARPW